MIEEIASFREDLGATLSLRRSTKHQLACGWLERRRHVKPALIPNPKILKGIKPSDGLCLTATQFEKAQHQISESAHGLQAEGKLCADKASVQHERNYRIKQEK